MSSLFAAACRAAFKMNPLNDANQRLEEAETSRMTALAPEEWRPEAAANVKLSRLVINKSAVSGGGGGGASLTFTGVKKILRLKR